ncbi:MAG TPA: hypothetical protein VGK54_06180, partial [Chloroflexota bacterium]
MPLGVVPGVGRIMAGDFKAEQVGSFLRPPGLLEARAAFDAGKLPLQKLRDNEDQSILRLLNLQREIGVDVASDGEYRRSGWASDFPDAVDGYVQGATPIPLPWR